MNELQYKRSITIRHLEKIDWDTPSFSQVGERK